ncbi:MAG: hypothetical protein Q8O66_03010 [bacterium]|nr:hypothetical protein [bacterium]
MGDTYFIKKINCVHCGKINNFINKKEMFAEMGLPFQFEFGSDFVCAYCRKKNKIIMDFRTVKSKAKTKKLKNKI